MGALLLPVALLPFFVFGYVALRSHYDALREHSVAQREVMATLAARQLDEVAKRTLKQLYAAASTNLWGAQDPATLRRALNEARKLDGDFSLSLFLDHDLHVIASSPPRPALEGKVFHEATFGAPGEAGFAMTPVVVNDDGMPRFFVYHAVKGGAGLLAVEVRLSAWAQNLLAAAQTSPTTLMALIPTIKNADPVGLGEKPTFDEWSKIAVLRGSDATEQEIDGEMYHVTIREVTPLKVRLVLAEPNSVIFASVQRSLTTFGVSLGLLLLALVVLTFYLAHHVTAPLKELGAAAREYGEGRFDGRLNEVRRDEFGDFIQTFNQMGAALQLSMGRMRVLHKAITELLSCDDPDSLLRKTVELVCTQCLGELAWFMPNTPGREAAYAEETVFVGLHSWAWKNHRSTSLSAEEAATLGKGLGESSRVFAFAMKSQTRELGTLKVVYPSSPDEHVESLLHALIALVETALLKQDQVFHQALVTTELTMAEAVQRNITAEGVLRADPTRVAYHYQPASRLGGDWFFVIEDPTRDSLFVVMGDVTGHGLAQGLVTTSVKGALDVIEHQMKRPHAATSFGPAEIVEMLATVVNRVGGHADLTMTCLAAQVDFSRRELRICNAGHTFPILVRREGDANSATHLHRNQQPLLGLAEGAVDPVAYSEAVYSLMPGDLLVLYTDGLTGAKTLKSGIFGRFLLRSLRKPREYAAAVELKDEILDMFHYYTQDNRIEDDVCFLVVQIAADDALEKGA